MTGMERPLVQYERWYTAHEKKRVKDTQPIAPKPLAVEPLPDNVIYVDFKARKRIK